MLLVVFRRSFPKTAAAMSTTQQQQQQQQQRREYRVLAYGDSLTAGTSGMELYPYAPYLERAVNQLRQARGDTAVPVVVRHRGMPGWTAANMLDDLDGARTGLRSAIRAVKDPSLSLVVLLAGTNDLGYGFGAEDITRNILALHQVCFQEGVPRTIAISIPPSGYQSSNAAAAALADTVSTNLEAFCNEEKRSLFHRFPFAFEQGGENWFPDTLHFSQKGYQSLGESLASIVDKALQFLDDDR